MFLSPLSIYSSTAVTSQVLCKCFAFVHSPVCSFLLTPEKFSADNTRTHTRQCKVNSSLLRSAQRGPVHFVVAASHPAVSVLLHVLTSDAGDRETWQNLEGPGPIWRGTVNETKFKFRMAFFLSLSHAHSSVDQTQWSFTHRATRLCETRTCTLSTQPQPHKLLFIST